ncbi:flagellin B, partial [Methylococcaceae bacterium HT5]
NDILPNDADGNVLAAVNNLTSQTGVQASVDARGHLVLTSQDGRGIVVQATAGLDVLGLELNSDNKTKHKNYGRLTLIRNDARDVIVVANDKAGKPTDDAHSIGFGKTDGTEAAEAVINLRSIRGPFNLRQASAMGAHTSKNSLLYQQTSKSKATPTGVTTFAGAQVVMDIADTAIKDLNKIRSDLGSVQIQLEATVNNISVTRTNVKFSESQIRDTDFASETSEFKKRSILAQAGSYALSQASTM